MKIKVIIVDDNPVYMAGIRAILDASDEILLIGEAKDGPEASNLVKEKFPDVVVMDISRHHGDCIQATKQILNNFPDTKVLAFSNHSDKSIIKEMLDAGASGYLLKNSASDELVRAIQKIANGDMYLSSSIISTVLSDEEARDETESHNILRTKLHRRPVSYDIVGRKDIIGQLEKNIPNPLSLVCAPAGYGKSTLVSQWLEQTTALYTWLSLDEELNDLRIFLFYFRAAIEKIFPLVLQKTGALLEAGELSEGRIIAHSLLNELDQIQEAYILVLDDYHLIHDKGIHQFLDEILRYPTENMHLVLLSRRDPPLNLSSLRSHGRMKEIRMEELAFSEENIVDLFQKLHNILLPEETARAIKEKSEGWIGGIRLAAQAIRNIEDLDRIAAQMKGDFHSITTFLAQEVLSLHPAGIQDLLMKSSLCDRFCEHMIDEVSLSDIEKGTPLISGNEFIQYLFRNNLFIVPLDDENHWFRYHHLFQDLLKKQLVQNHSADQIKGIHSQTSKWFESKGFIGEAIRHGLLAEDHTWSVELIKKYRHIEYNKDRWYIVQNWLAIFPEEIVSQHIELQLARLLPLFEQFRLLEMSQILEHMESLMPEKNPEPAVEGEISFIQGILSFFLKGDIDNSRKLLTKAKKQVPENQKLIRGEIELYLAIMLHFTGEGELAFKSLTQSLKTTDSSDFMIYSRLLFGLFCIHNFSGDITLALKAAERMRILAILYHNNFLEATAYYSKANAHLQTFDLEKALPDFNSAIHHRHILNIKFAIDSMVGQCLSFHFMGQTQEAFKKLQQFLEFAQNTGDAQHIAFAESFRARLSLLQGDISTAINWARSFNLEIQALGMLSFLEIPSITQARVLIMAGTDADLNRSLELLGTLLKQVRNLHNTYQEIEILILQSIAFEKLEKSSDALGTLEEVLMLAAPRGWIRPFVEAGAPLAGLLKELLHKNVEVAFIEKLLTLIELESTHSSSITIEPRGNKPYPAQSYAPEDQQKRLTQRETEILNLLSEGMRNKEIASRIHVSEDTVKKHFYNIFQKMDVNSRMELVNKAKSIGLLSD